MRTSRLVALSTLGIAVVALSAGCRIDLNLNYNYIDDTFSSADKVTSIRIDGQNGGGNVTVRADDSVTGAQVKRHVRYTGSQAPGQTASVSESTLVLKTDCGHQCGVSYEVALPTGATIIGSNDSGNISLSGVGSVDLKLESGNMDIDEANGPVTVRADSGNLKISNVEGAVTATASSGNVQVRDVRGALTVSADSGNVDATGLTGGNVKVETDSGRVRLEIDGTGDAYVRVGSGNLEITVPNNVCRIAASTGSGNTHVNVASNPAGSCSIDAHAGSGNVDVRSAS